MIKYKKIWFNPSWKEGADSDESAMARAVLRGMGELGYSGYGRKLLDYGCGNGTLAKYFRWYTTHTVGMYDPIIYPIMPHGLFDFITCVHVIEHAKDPIKIIQEIKEKLEVGGLLCLVCHNVVCWPNKRAREPWHRWLFGKDIVQIIEAEGFKLKARLTWGGCTSKIRWIKQPINWLRKKLGIGDVQMVIMERI
jgi:hypothetical protein